MGGIKDREAKKKANHVYRCASLQPERERRSKQLACA
jgi:hypothetical protein